MHVTVIPLLKLIQKFYFKLVTVDMFFGCRKPVFGKFLCKRFGHKCPLQTLINLF